MEDGVLSICCSRRVRKTARFLCRGGCRRRRKTMTVASPVNRKVKKHDAYVLRWIEKKHDPGSSDKTPALLIQDLAMKDRLSKMRLLESLIAKKDPLVEYEEAG
ncbi:hypothetical protein DY000_02008809 [Brassica cretica]|uniref:Uncharacterized protein n=1 Tax=Brassica cretica TaxID=69181 RepID=A0ABQ7C721_BRACR|nr:hypothetical protein DY000_02008809 [Brassica cretica]